MDVERIIKRREQAAEHKASLEKVANECFRIFKQNSLTVGDVNRVLKICESKTLTSKVD